MAVITISRQVAALGDEIATALAKALGYQFITRQMIEARIIELGFPKDKMEKYDERKPGFFASLAKVRDEYLDYLQTAVLEAATKNNCILIGRGAFAILDDVPNKVAVRFVAHDDVRLERLSKEFSWNEKQSQNRINESDTNRSGFHKNFFNILQEDPSFFHITINTAIVDIGTSVALIKTLKESIVGQKEEEAGEKKISDLFTAQTLINKLVFEHKLNINFLRAVINGKTIVLQGVADSAALAERAVSLSADIMSGYKIDSVISIVQDFRAYP
ncbi:MAG: cytidylate kinase family protein [Treponemataceae bacterium]|nr:MAG: cytidylate kinase family protein [Treponemataceae bacterium]